VRDGCGDALAAELAPESAEVKSRGTVDSEPVARLRPSPLSPWQTEQ
jgi:hypothetical protein